MTNNPNLTKITSLAKRRGFVYQNSEVYGGIQGFYDYGPLGVELKNNLKRLWWLEMTRNHEDIVGIDGAIISHPKVWEASGHVKSFTDAMVDCKKCKKRFRAEELVDEKCPDCGAETTSPRKFNILVEASIGVIEKEKRTVYLRGEACQNIYLNYQNILNSTRKKVPFGICQIGKAFRNEVTPKQFLFRTIEFEQWDLQWFVNPKQMKKWFEYWKKERFEWYRKIFNHQKNIRLREHGKDELAHYAKAAFDIEYNTPFGWKEAEGIHSRADWDLSRHGKYSNNDFTYTDPDSGEKFLPWIVETSGGVDRTILFLLFDAYHEQEIKGKKRVILKLRAELAPYKMAIFPLLANKPELVSKAEKLYKQLNKKYSAIFDDRGNIGKRYFSQDEIGTPWCLTVDFQSLDDDTVTVRDRDTTEQVRIKINALNSYFEKKLSLC